MSDAYLRGQYASELAFGISLAKEAGKIMQRYFRAEDIGTEWKEDSTPLTIADTTINDLVIERVQKAFPEHGVIGEEASFEDKRDFVWVVDPIDGTMPFSLGMPLSTFSLALVDRSDGRSIVAVVYDPFLDELYTAQQNEGAFLNQVRLHTGKQQDYASSYISVLGGVGDNENARKHFFKQGACVDFLRGQGAITFTIQSQVYSACKVATGQFAGSVFGYGSPWDSAAASLIVTEAGGVVTDINGKPRRYDEFAAGCVLAPNKAMSAKLLEAVKHAAV
jgi:myo-inositol-1(or 4)-monophosphatase